MNKESFLRMYNRVNIAFGIMIVLFVVVFVAQIPTTYAGLIEKSIFSIGFAGVTIFNGPMFVYISLLLLNIYLLIRIKDTKVDNKHLESVVFYNFVLLLMLLIGHLVCYFSIPDAMNGLVENNFVFLRFQIRSNEFLNVVNVNYILSATFLIYNLFVAYKSPTEKVQKFDEELFADQYYKSLNEDE